MSVSTRRVLVERSAMHAAALGLVPLGAMACANPVSSMIESMNMMADSAGQRMTEVRHVAPFAEVSVRGGGTLAIRQTGEESLTVTAPGRQLGAVTSEVRGGRLVLDSEAPSNAASNVPKRLTHAAGAVHYELTVRDLRAIETSGTATVEVNEVRASQVRVGMRGAGNTRLTGQVDRLEVRVTGAGQCDGSGLESRDALVVTSGEAQVVVHATETLDATVDGPSRVEYLGEPALKLRITGHGAITQRGGR